MLRKIGKKKTLIAALAVVLAAALLIALLPNGKTDTSSVKVVEELLSAKAEYGTINTVFTSGGAISNSGTESIALAGSVKLRSWEVSEGDYVEAGDLLATVDRSSVLQAISELDALMQALFAAYERGGVYAGNSGRVTGLNEDILSSTGGSTGSSTHLAARLLGMPQRLSAIIIEPVSEDEGEDTGEGGTTEPGGSEEPSNPDPVEPSPEPGDGKTTEKFGKVTAVDEEAGTVTVRLTDGSDLTLDAAELETLGASQISVGNILALGYDESGTLVSVTVYSSGGQDDPTGGGEMPSGGMGGGGMSGGTASAEDDIPKDYIMDETELCTLTDYDTAEITLTVDELDIAQLSIGQAVTVTLDALPGQSFDGEITEIDPNGENSGGSTKYSVTVTLPRTEDMLTGMNAAVRVQLRENDGRLLIPLAAVQEDANGIYVCTGYDKSSDEATDPIEITTGLSDGENVEVLSGLSEGDTVYYRYADTLEYSFVK